jgi:N-acetylmuramoyl-L-alanine amidase
MREHKTLLLVMGLAFIVAFCGYMHLTEDAPREAMSLSTTSKTIVIDPGHGGFDPGKVGPNGALEKDINLAIALKLKNYLAQAGHTVVMTRETDQDLDGMEGKNHKNKDMRQRKEIINEAHADVLISIHQNAFTQPSVKGAQTFYHSASQEGKVLAHLIQSYIKQYVDSDNSRPVKSTDSYYVLKATNVPAVIVECGFLTNPEEEAKLMTNEYQDKLASAIYQAIMAYFNQ